MPKALQKPPSCPPQAPTEPCAVSPTRVWDKRKRLGSRRDNLVHGAFRVGGQRRHTAKEEMMGNKRTSNDNSRVLQLAHELHSHSVRVVIFYSRSIIVFRSSSEEKAPGRP